MVNRASSGGSAHLVRVSWLVGVYVVIVLGTLVALVVMTAVAPSLATDESWGHAVVVGLFALVLPLRLRAARRGSRRALLAVTVIAAVLAAVNLVEAALPAFPVWMRGEMLVVAVLMLAVGVQGVLARRDCRLAG